MNVYIKLYEDGLLMQCV